MTSCKRGIFNFDVSYEQSYSNSCSCRFMIGRNLIESRTKGQQKDASESRPKEKISFDLLREWIQVASKVHKFDLLSPNRFVHQCFQFICVTLFNDIG